MIKAGEIKIRQGVFWTAKDDSSILAPLKGNRVWEIESRKLINCVVTRYCLTDKESVK